MASQEEVLEALAAMDGSANIKELKAYFGISECKGSSWIPQRLTALEKKDEIKRIILETGKTRYILT